MDGDTVRVGRRWRRTTVRLLGIDTPETVHPEKPVEFYGPGAATFMEQSLKRKRVHLAFGAGNEIDDDGRLPAYVFLEDGTLFTRDLIRIGHARAYTRFPLPYQEEFRLVHPG